MHIKRLGSNAVAVENVARCTMPVRGHVTVLAARLPVDVVTRQARDLPTPFEHHVPHVFEDVSIRRVRAGKPRVRQVHFEITKQVVPRDEVVWIE